MIMSSMLGDLEEHRVTFWVCHSWEFGLVCKLCRSLYGLKQSPRAWFGKFNHIYQFFGLKCSEVDHSVLYCHTYPRKCVDL